MQPLKAYHLFEFFKKYKLCSSVPDRNAKVLQENLFIKKKENVYY